MDAKVFCLLLLLSFTSIGEYIIMATLDAECKEEEYIITKPYTCLGRNFLVKNDDDHYDYYTCEPKCTFCTSHEVITRHCNESWPRVIRDHTTDQLYERILYSDPKCNNPIAKTVITTSGNRCYPTLEDSYTYVVQDGQVAIKRCTDKECRYGCKINPIPKDECYWNIYDTRERIQPYTGDSLPDPRPEEPEPSMSYLPSSGASTVAGWFALLAVLLH